MEKIKIGILTLYYKNYNFGGLLQAFALQYYLDSIGLDSEQITFDSNLNDLTFLKRNIYSRTGIRKMKTVFRYFMYMIKIFTSTFFFLRSNINISRRKKRFNEFQQIIPHSKECFTEQNIKNALEKYDIFICGSDVIWNAGIDPFISCLGFVKGKYKFSYAASLGSSTIPEGWYGKYEKFLLDLDDISVREESIRIELQKRLYKKTVKCVVDPTLLLTPDDWYNIIEEKSSYINNSGVNSEIVCYLLGSSKKQRISISKRVKNLNYDLRVFPYIENRYRHIDYGFGTIRDFESGPIEFLQKILKSKLVITDSFHAVVFSLLFHKEFWVLKRYNKEIDSGINGRIYNLLCQVGLEDRIIRNDQIESIELFQHIDFLNVDKSIDKMRAYSKKYIYENIKAK